MSPEPIAKNTEERLTELEMKVDVMDQLPQRLALAPSNCCNSCNNVRAQLQAEEGTGGG